jgi:hypothetical protein
MTPPTRTRLPNRRRSDLVTFSFEGLNYTAQYTMGPDGLQEVFLDASKEGTAANVMAREMAVVTSIALQFGVPFDVLRDALPKLGDGAAAGPLGAALAAIAEACA